MSINLEKKQSINLKKANGDGLRNVRLGLGWDAAKRKGFLGMFTSRSIDLDASAVMVSRGSVVENVSFMHLRSYDGSIQHTGDNLTGDGDGDDESILVNLQAVNPSVDTIVFVVNSYTGQRFTDVENAFVRLVDSDNHDEEVARFDLSGFGDYTGMVMASLKRSGDGWIMSAIGDPANGRTVDHVAAQAAKY